MNSPSAIRSDVPLIILPCNSKNYGTVWFGQALENLMLLILGVGLDKRHNRRNEFFDRLMKLRLAAISLNQSGHETVNVFTRFDPHIVFLEIRGLSC